MKNSITFLFTFIILAIGAVFTAPTCKAVEYTDLQFSAPTIPISTSWSCARDQLPEVASRASIIANGTIDEDDIYVFEFINTATYHTFIYVCPRPSTDQYPVFDIFYYNTGFKFCLNSNNGYLIYACSADLISNRWEANSINFIDNTLNYDSTTYKELPVNSNFLRNGGQFYCNFRGNIRVADDFTPVPTYEAIPYIPMLFDVSESVISNSDSPSNFRALFQGSFDITYIDDDTGTSFPVNVLSTWYNKNGVETEILRLGIIDSNDIGYSYNGHFHFVNRTSSLTAFKWLIGTADYDTLPDFELPTVDNSQNLLTYNFDLIGSNDTVIHYALPSSNRYNIDIGNGDVRYKGFKDTLLASQFDSEFTSPEICSNFTFNFIDYYPYNVHVPTYILDGELHGEGVKEALDNAKLDDETSSYHPVTFTGQTVPVDFPDFSLDNFDFSGINSLFGSLFDSWYIFVLFACISIGIIGYVLFGKN